MVTKLPHVMNKLFMMEFTSALKAGQTELSMSQQLMHILQAHETCDTQEWGSHVCMLRSSVNIGSMKDIQTVKDSAKSYIGDLIRNGRWKKEPARNQTAFPANSSREHLGTLFMGVLT